MARVAPVGRGQIRPPVVDFAPCADNLAYPHEQTKRMIRRGRLCDWSERLSAPGMPACQRAHGQLSDVHGAPGGACPASNALEETFILG